MKKVKHSKKEKIRAFWVFILIQVIIVLLFLCLIQESQQIDINDTKQVEITVDGMRKYRLLNEYRLIVDADSVSYMFNSPSTSEEYSVAELYESISVGDRLLLIYYEDSFWFTDVNFVVDARTETEVYRSFEENNRAKEGLPTILLIVFAIIELIFLGIVWINIWLWYRGWFV